MKLLIVDDSTAMRMIVKKTLRMAGFSGLDIQEADDGTTALEKINEFLPDLILADWNMPQMTGIELLEALNEKGVNIDFGFVTTEATAEMRTRAENAGAKFLIAKPFNAQTFENTLQPFMH